LPNGSSETAAMFGGVQWVRSMLLFSATERLKPATEAVVHKVAVSLKSHVRFMAESALNLAQRSQRLLSPAHYRSGAPKIHTVTKPQQE
jgi:hypothetical protein